MILPFIFLALPFSVFGQSADLIAVLNNAGLTSLASAAAAANQTPQGKQLISTLLNSSQSYTLFAPDNAAFAVPAVAQVAANATLLASVLSYHVLPGNFVSNNALTSSIFPSITVGRTLLTNNALVHLEGSKGQVLAWTRNDSNSPIYFLNQTPQTTITNSTILSNILIVQITSVLTPPSDLPTTISNPLLSLSSLSNLAGMITIPGFYPNGTNASLAQALGADMTRGYTLFAPSNDALTAAGSALASVANNQTALLALLGNHYINGTSRYSPTLLSTPSSPSSFISNSGQSLKFTSNSSGAYVITENTSSAKIIQSDVLVNNGVVHIVDRVLVDLGVDSSKAASA
ncbi:Fasciclin-domain-containing protein [Tricholoma matsutake]|nr:Fasciclin-domain-containing protein [Tricholoma matsutake 945]